MTKSGSAEKKLNRDPKEGAPAKTTTTTTNAADPAPAPLKPLPTLFRVLLVGFAVWLGVLLTLYFKTVYPLRHTPSTDAAATRPGASALPIAPR